MTIHSHSSLGENWNTKLMKTWYSSRWYQNNYRGLTFIVQPRPDRNREVERQGPGGDAPRQR